MLSEDTKGVVASNLTIAKAIVHYEKIKGGETQSGTVAQAIIEKLFQQFNSLLNQEEV